MEIVLLMALGFFAVGLVVGAILHSPWAYLYPAAVVAWGAYAIVDLISTGSLPLWQVGASIGPGILWVLLFATGPAVSGTLIGLSTGRAVSKR